VRSRFGAKSLVPALLLFIGLSIAQSDEGDRFSYPPFPDEKLFTALKTTSPFLRTINISETYVLRAVATFEELAYARVYNRDTKQTITIEVGGEPQQGLGLLKIVGPRNATDLTGVSARISFAGEVAELKYEPGQLTPTSRGGSGASSSSRGGNPDDKRRGPSSKDRESYHKLSDDKKKKLQAYIKATVKKYPNMPREERGNLIRGALQKLGDGRDIEIPK